MRDRHRTIGADTEGMVLLDPAILLSGPRTDSKRLFTSGSVPETSTGQRSCDYGSRELDASGILISVFVTCVGQVTSFSLDQ